MADTKHHAVVLADAAEMLRTIPALEAELRRLSASEAALLEALERAESSLRDYQHEVHYSPELDGRNLEFIRAAIARTKASRA